MMEALQFKTNINCGSCVAKVTPGLDDVAGAENWNVNILDPRKILTVETEGAPAWEIIEAVNKAGFKIEELTN